MNANYLDTLALRLTAADFLPCVSAPWKAALDPSRIMAGWRDSGVVPFTRAVYWEQIAAERKRRAAVALTAERDEGAQKIAQRYVALLHKANTAVGRRDMLLARGVRLRNEDAVAFVAGARAAEDGDADAGEDDEDAEGGEGGANENNADASRIVRVLVPGQKLKNHHNIAGGPTGAAYTAWRLDVAATERDRQAKRTEKLASRATKRTNDVEAACALLAALPTRPVQAWTMAELKQVLLHTAPDVRQFGLRKAQLVAEVNKVVAARQGRAPAVGGGLAAAQAAA